VASRPSRKGRWAAAAALLLLLFWLWPATPEPVPVPPPEPPPPPVAVAKPVAVKKKPVARKPAPPPAPAPVASSQRALLRRAMEARAPDLRACPLPPGVPPTLGAKIRVAKGGATQSATLSSGGQRLPRELSDCLRQHLLKWEFSDVGLTSDVEIFVDFALGK